MALLKYEIIAPTNVVETSVSDEPDDVSAATIRIKARWTKGAFPAGLKQVQFTVPVGSDARALTSNPKSISPTVKEHGAWTFVQESEANGVFIATPTATDPGTDDVDVLPGINRSATFILHDLEVVTTEGDVIIDVRELVGDGPSAPAADPLKPLKVRKQNPSLRIDYFRAVGPGLAASPGSPLAPVIRGLGKVSLEWATTAATKVALIGPDGSFVPRPAGKVGNFDGSHPEDKDGDVEVSPPSTGTYTLIAQKGNDDKVRAVQQVTVTVLNQDLRGLTRFLSQDSQTENVRIQADGKIGIGINNPAEKLHINAGNLRVDNGEIQSSGPIKFRPNVGETTDGEVSFFPRTGDSPHLRIGTESGGEPSIKSAQRLIFKDATSNDEQMRIDSDGKVSIGKPEAESSEPEEEFPVKLHVKGTVRFDEGHVKIGINHFFKYNTFSDTHPTGLSEFLVPTFESSTDWLAIVVGFTSETPVKTIRPFVDGGADKWVIQCTFVGASKRINLEVLFINRKLINFEAIPPAR